MDRSKEFCADHSSPIDWLIFNSLKEGTKLFKFTLINRIQTLALLFEKSSLCGQAVKASVFLY